MARHVIFHAHERYFDLQRRVCQNAQKLRFRYFFYRHKIDDRDFERTDILRFCPFVGHDEYVFALEDAARRQIRLNLNWHNKRV